MGSETSKPLEPPTDWDRRGNQFQIISPVSDISNPSDIHKIHRFNAHSTQQRSRDRRKSRTIADKVSQNQNKEVPPPSAFYFPTKETEKRIEKARRSMEQDNSGKENRKPKGLKKLVKNMKGCFASDGATKHELEQIQEERSHDLQKKQKKPSSKSQQQVANRRVSDFDVKPSKGQARMSTSSQDTRRKESIEQRSEQHQRKLQDGPTDQPNTGIQEILSSAEHKFVIRETDGMVDPKTYAGQNEVSNGMEGVALHHEDAYFARLTTADPSRYSEIQDSPFAANEAIRNIPSALGPTEDKSVTDSPISNLFASKDMTDFEESELKNGEEEGEAKGNDTSNSDSKTSIANCTVVNSLLQFHPQMGQLVTGTNAYSNEEEAPVDVFVDEGQDSFDHKEVSTNSSSRRSRAADISVNSDPSAIQSRMSAVTMSTFATEERSERESLQEYHNKSHQVQQNKHSNQLVTYDDNASDDESAVLSYFRPEEKNTKSAFRTDTDIPDEPLKQIAALGPSDKEPQRTKVSKLESLFRPVLPALSADDAETTSSYDPYLIKVTESAPSVIESGDYRALALRNSFGSPQNRAESALAKQLGAWSPSMMSIDSAVHQSPAMTKVLVSDQAACNAEFLFSSEYGKERVRSRTQSDRDSAIFSISTLGARSRTSARTKAVPIPVRSSQSVSSDDFSGGSSSSMRRVRFSTDSSSVSNASKIVAKSVSPEINVRPSQSKMSSMSNIDANTGTKLVLETEEDHEVDLAKQSPVAEVSSPGAEYFEEDEESQYDLDQNLDDDAPPSQELDEHEREEDRDAEVIGTPSRVNQSSPSGHGQWYTTSKNGVSAVTPHLKGRALKQATNSPYLRYQAARNRFGNQEAEEDDFPTIDVPAIESKVSDLTDTYGDFVGRASIGSSKGGDRQEVIPEETSESPSPVKEQIPQSPEMQVHWSYSVKDGNLSAVTPQIKGKALKNATNSPFLRFKSAKKKFADPTVTTKEVPVKSPKQVKPKRSKKKTSSGGVVSSRIDALNQRVRETRKLRKKQRGGSVGNPRRHNFVAMNHIRSCAILNYKTEKVDIEKINYMGACKFNRIPDPVDDDESIASSAYSETELSYEEIMKKHLPALGIHQRLSTDEGVEEDDDDMSQSSATVATVLQDKENPSHYRTRASEGSHSTISNSLSNVRKQVFRSSNVYSKPRQSLVSSAESTTMSSILGKENQALPFRSASNTVKPTEINHKVAADPESLHLSPTQRTPMEARKWRSLAAAAQEKDSQKRTKANTHRGLSVRNSNQAMAMI